ncbi:hypothetical protein B0D78_09765 [Pyramidobacter sp. C12-8]|nr:hypothetical protein B0D78_09765 [Pyramidobacter sp. C12-8]
MKGVLVFMVKKLLFRRNVDTAKSSTTGSACEGPPLRVPKTGGSVRTVAPGTPFPFDKAAFLPYHCAVSEEGGKLRGL